MREHSRQAKTRKHIRVRKRVFGTPEQPRLSVFRSLNHIYAQVVDDVSGSTVVAASTVDPDIRPNIDGKKKTEQAELVGALVGKRAQDKGISQVVFDRGGCKYHGRIKALAEAARKAGLRF